MDMEYLRIKYIKVYIMNIVERAKQVKLINKEGCTVDFNSIIIVNEKYQINQVPDMPKDSKYLIGRSALVHRITNGVVSIADPLSKGTKKWLPTRILVNAKGYTVTKGRLVSGNYKHFAVVVENEYLPVGTVIHDPIQQNKDGITCYDIEGKPVVMPYHTLTGLKSNTVKTASSVKHVSIPIEQSEGIKIESKVITESEVPASILAQVKDTVIHGIISDAMDSFKDIFSSKFLDDVEASVLNEADVFTDLDGNIHESLKAVLEANESILKVRIKAKIKSIVINKI